MTAPHAPGTETCRAMSAAHTQAVSGRTHKKRTFLNGCFQSSKIGFNCGIYVIFFPSVLFINISPVFRIGPGTLYALNNICGINK